MKKTGQQNRGSADVSAASHPEEANPWFVSRRVVVFTLLLLLLVTLPGCRGCRRSTAQTPEELEKELEERRAKLAKERKPDLQMEKLRCYPHEPKADRTWCKPGHWTCSSLAAKANNFDLLGELETAVTDGRGNPAGLVGMPFSLQGSRSITLAKGQRKTFDPIFFIPANGRQSLLSYRITIRKGGRGGEEASQLVSLMPGYQYHFAVLARTPGSYTFLKTIDSVRMPSNMSLSSEEHGYYQVVLLEGTQPSTLPSYGLFWTSIAYLLWDDADPEKLTLDQKLALLDWLHWGGQLIVSGPDSLDSLRHSFLDPYLPATTEGKRDLTEADLAPINARWTVPTRGGHASRLSLVRPWSGINLKLTPQASEVPGTGGLLVQRRAGRGRVLVSAFRLSERELRNWPSFDQFINACLLGRPPRKYFVDQQQGAAVTWADQPQLQYDPRRVSNLLYFTRDTGRKSLFFQSDQMVGLDFGSETQLPETFYSDVASWNDFNAVANAARESLQTAARIEVPHRSFVLWVVGGYLLVLVPINWLLFRLMGRVEWAWAAAPVIAIVCTVVVIRLARLDIGFARSMTEVAVVELQGDYPRAHVTRYNALYTSLTTQYEFRAKDLGTQVQPFPTVGSPDKFRLLPGQGLTPLKYVYGSDVSLAGFSIASNSTGLVHCEQMVDLDGPITLMRTSQGQSRVVNRTPFTVYGAGVVRKDERNNVQIAWLGTLKPGESAPLEFTTPPKAEPNDALWVDERRQTLARGEGLLPKEVDLHRMLALAEDSRELAPGQTRLVGWSNEGIAGLEIAPAAPQAKYAVLIVANLEHGPGREPRPDVNTREDVGESPAVSMRAVSSPLP
jgi:hypothetical protein